MVMRLSSCVRSPISCRRLAIKSLIAMRFLLLYGVTLGCTGESIIVTPSLRTKQRVDSDKGKHIYSHRMSVVEPVFGNISVHKRLNRFSLRGKKKVQSQWRLFCLVHNIEKLMGYGQLDTS